MNSGSRNLAQSILKVFMHTLSALLCVLTISTLGLFQLIAWGSMLPTYSLEAGSWNRGLADILSGERPCSLCEAVQETRESEEKNRPRTTQVKLESVFSKRGENGLALHRRDSTHTVVYFSCDDDVPPGVFNRVEVPPPEFS